MSQSIIEPLPSMSSPHSVLNSPHTGSSPARSTLFQDRFNRLPHHRSCGLTLPPVDLASLSLQHIPIRLQSRFAAHLRHIDRKTAFLNRRHRNMPVRPVTLVRGVQVLLVLLNPRVRQGERLVPVDTGNDEITLFALDRKSTRLNSI